MNFAIRKFIANIPLAKSLYHVVRQRREKLRARHAQAELEKKQPVIRQGSPECFESLPLFVSWMVTSHCNYRCSYCFSAGKEYKKVFCTLEQAETAIKHIASTNRPSYQVNLIGGEPTTHPHLDKIVNLLCHHLGDRLEMLQITSNGSFGESQMEAILKASEQVRVNLLVSVHLEYMDVERVVELVKRYSSRTRLQIALMFHPELIDKAMCVADALIALRKDYSFRMYPGMLWEAPYFDKYDGRYTEEHFNQAERIRERFGKVSDEAPERHENQQKTTEWKFLVEREIGGATEYHERLSLSELKDLTGNVFTGMTCCAGTSIVRIGVDGRTKGVLCRLDLYTYNIFEENPFVKDDWMHAVACTKSICECNINFRTPKFRSPAAAEKFIAEKKLEQKKLMCERQEIS